MDLLVGGIKHWNNAQCGATWVKWCDLHSEAMQSLKYIKFKMKGSLYANIILH